MGLQRNEIINYIGVCTAHQLAIVGGNWNNDLNAGPFNVNLNNQASNSNTNNGAALSYPGKKKSHIMRCISPDETGKRNAYTDVPLPHLLVKINSVQAPVSS